LIADPKTPGNLKNRLELILQIRRFARDELYLPAANHYMDYVDVGRSYVAWNVFAAPEFSLIPKTWCYPVAGCAVYRGYFREEKAQRYADMLARQGYDVFVGGVTAYSTLGWFDDPLLSTILNNRNDMQLAALIFHELAHQKLFIPGDSTFNESFATAVEQEGLRRWQRGSRETPGYETYLETYRRKKQIMALITRSRLQLAALYQQELAADHKRDKKRSILKNLIAEYRELRNQWNGFSAYDGWFSEPLNNAKITVLATYHEFVPAFLQILQEGDGDLKQFYRKCQVLAQADKRQRHRRLLEYVNN
jgi:predicted aminopeptidase